MTRPENYRTQLQHRRCGTCQFALAPEYKDDLLCFFGDMHRVTIEVPGDKDGTVTLMFDGKEVGLMDGDEYDQVWGGRVVDPTCVCDKWQTKP